MKKLLKNFAKICKAIWSKIKKIDDFLMKYRVYVIIPVCVMLATIFLFNDSFYQTKTFSNYANLTTVPIHVEENMSIQYTFEAKTDVLSQVILNKDMSKCRLTSSDKAIIHISNSSNQVILEKEVYLYHPSHTYISLDCDNLKVEKGEIYYVTFEVSQLAETSSLYLDMHAINSFDQLGVDEMSQDIPVGFEYVPNISYQYSSINVWYFLPNALLFIGALALLFIKPLYNKRWFNETFRAIFIPMYIYLFVELLNIEKNNSLQMIFPLTAKHLIVLLAGIAIVLLLYALFYAITGRGSIAMLIVCVIVAAIAYTSHTKMVMRGDAYVPWDIYSAGIAATIGSKYHFTFTTNFFVSIALIISIILLIRVTWTPKIPKVKYRLAFGLTTLVLLVAFSFGFVTNTTLLKKMKISYALYPVLESYNENGTLLAFVLNLNNIFATGAEANTPEATEDVLQQYIDAVDEAGMNEIAASSEVKPNVICIMSESYCDLRNIRDIETSEPVMPYFDYLMPETQHGNLAVSIFAGGTCNTEFEFLTGFSVSGLLAGSSVYTFYVNNQLATLPAIYRENGYQTTAIHPFDANWWDRSTTYPVIGFDTFISRQDFEDPSIVRRYISDQAAFERIVYEYENKAEGQPIFEFCVTMQNHGDYSQSYDNMAYDVQLTGLVDEEYPYAEQYLSLIRESDDALKYLIEYFRNADEPTIIVFFGDHLPALDQGFYDKLLATDIGTMSASESLPLFQTPYFVWANYPISTGDTGVTSPNFLGQHILDMSGVDSPDERACLRYLTTKVSAISALAVYDLDGTPWLNQEDLPQDVQDVINDYLFVQYGQIFFEDTDADDDAS